MAKKKLASTFPNMVIVLVAVTLISSAALSMVYKMTTGRIEASQENKKLEAIKQVVLADYDNSPSQDMFKIPADNNDMFECYPTKKNGVTNSVAVKTYSPLGFSGKVWLMVGFLPDGTINKISVVEQKETPGLGTKMVEPAYKGQYENKNPATYDIRVKKDGGQIDAITAATISSRAFSHAVDRAYKAFMNYQKEQR